MAERKSADEGNNSGNQAVEEVEDSHGPYADKVEEGSSHTEVCERLAQAFVDTVVRFLQVSIPGVFRVL